MEPPPNPPEYSEDSPSMELLSQYDPEAQTPTRFTKLQHWKLRLLDPCAEAYAHMSLKLEMLIAKMGNPLIVKRLIYVVIVSLIFYALSFTGVMLTDGADYMGFSNHDELLEAATIDYKQLEETIEYLASVDHIAGTTGDLAVAEYVHKAMEQGSLNYVQWTELKTLLNFPGSSIVSYDDVVLDVSEQFNPLSFNGEAEGQLVYLHNGFPSDYEKLKGVNVQNSIAIITINDQIPISQTALLAQLKGVKGILFIDSEGSYNSTYERISLAVPQFGTGDPLTPGWSTSVLPNRLDESEAHMLRIPSVSLSRTQARPLLDKLYKRGIKFDNEEWSGDMKDDLVNLKNNVNYIPDHSIWDVLGKIEGKEQPDKALLIGVQRDSICSGGINPNSGTAIMLALINIMSKWKQEFNWKPLRSIYFLSVDASEYDFAGITELVEAKSGEVRKEAIAYIDLSGHMINDGDLEVTVSGLLKELLDTMKDDLNLQISEMFDEFDNFIPMMNEGIPVVKPKFKGSKAKCQSTFSDLKEIDPNYQNHSKLIKLLLKLILSIADEPLIPFSVSQFSATLDMHLRSLQVAVSGLFPHENIDFNSLLEPLLQLKQFGKDFEMWQRAWKELVSDDGGIEPSLLSVHRWNWNSRLHMVGKAMIDLDGTGVTDRRWFRNLLCGPAMSRPEGDNVDWFSFPGIRDAIERGASKEEVEAEIQRAGEIIQRGSKYIVSYKI